MTPLELLVNDATIRTITLELLVMILEASFALMLYVVYSTGIAYNDHLLMFIICL